MNALLAIVPPYRHRHCPPAGAAALLGHLRANGINSVRFLDLRPVTPDALSPTFHPVGLFGESFVIDVPDLPLVLRLLRAFDDGEERLIQPRDDVFDRYCLSHQIDPIWLHGWCEDIDNFLVDSLSHLNDVDFVGFSVWSSNLFTTLLAAAHLRRRSKPPFIVLGGPQVSESYHSASLALESRLVDAVVVGEGETAFAEIIRRLSGNEGVSDVPRVMLRRNHLSRPIAPTVTGEMSRKAMFARPAELGPLLKIDQLAKPDFTEMDLHAYRSPGGQWRLPFQLSRGCTDRCSFCSEWVFWERFRIDTVEHALDQIEALKQEFRVETFHFTDSLLNGHMRRLRAFAEGLLSRELRIDWGGFMRADMDPQTATLLRAAGCTYAYIGVESFSDETLEAMNKRRTKADNVQAIQAFLDAGIRVSVGVIPGFPGDTRDRFFATALELAALSAKYADQFSFNIEPFVVSPAQPIYRALDSCGLTAHRWDEEVLGIAPAYRPVTERIPCHVTGANQGIDRLGELRLLEVMFGSTSSGNANRMSEDLPSERARFIDLGPATLIVIKERGRMTGRLLTNLEALLLRDIVRNTNVTQALAQRSSFRKHWEAVTSLHAWPPSSLLLPTRTFSKLKQVRNFYVPGHVIGRELQIDSEASLLVANILTEEIVWAPVWMTPLIGRLSESTLGAQDILERADRSREEQEISSNVLESMFSRGMLCATDWVHHCKSSSKGTSQQ